jgi:hypothetical protein
MQINDNDRSRSKHRFCIWKKHQNFARYLLRPLTQYLDHHVNVFLIVFILMEYMHAYSVVCLHKWNFRMLSSPLIYANWICECFLFCLFIDRSRSKHRFCIWKKHQNFARYLLRPLTQYLDHHHIYKQTIRKILTNSIYFDKQ